jgi:hypothetical protein
MKDILIKYEPVRDINLDFDISLFLNNSLDRIYYEGEDIYATERFIGYTIVGKIEGDKMYIAYSVCNYEAGDKFIKKAGVESALNKCNSEKASVIVELNDIPIDETIKVFHGYADNLAEKIHDNFKVRRIKYWIDNL